jgi:hypothetical protein
LLSGDTAGKCEAAAEGSGFRVSGFRKCKGIGSVLPP